MKPIYIKILNIVLIAFFIINLMMISSQSSDSHIQINGNRQKILVLYNSDLNSTVQALYSDRNAIDNTSLYISMLNIDNKPGLTNLVNNKTLKQNYDEFWVIIDNISENPALMNDVITHLLSTNLPLFIWSPDLSSLNASVLNNLGINSCTTDKVEYNDSSLGFDYSSSSNLTSLLKEQTLPVLQSINDSIAIADCTLSQNSYGMVNLISQNSNSIDPIPLLFQPYFKSNILVASFILKSSLNDDSHSSATTTATGTTTTTTSEESTTETSTSDTSNTLLANNLVTAKIQQISSISLMNMISSLTYSMNFDWTRSPNINNVFTSGYSTTGSLSSTGTYSTIQPGFQLPTIDQKLATNITIGAVILALISLVFLILRRYWIIFLSFIVGLFAVFKVPSRKISVLDVYHNETRQNIIDVLNFKKGQGETVRNLSRELQIPLPTLLWHLQILEEFELIVKEKVRREIVIISMDYIEKFDLELKIFEMTFKSDKAKIFYDYLLNLDQNQVFTITSIVNHTSWSARTVIRYISKLLELEIIQQNPIGKGYRITDKYFHKLQDLF